MFTKYLYILLLLISSFVLNSNEAIACCAHNEKTSTEETQENCHNTTNDNEQSSKCCCKHLEQSENGSTIPCGNCECNCLQTVSYITSEFSLEINLTTITSYFTYGWDYNQPLPEKPMNSIWQPPQLT